MLSVIRFLYPKKHNEQKMTSEQGKLLAYQAEDGQAAVDVRLPYLIVTLFF